MMVCIGELSKQEGYGYKNVVYEVYYECCTVVPSVYLTSGSESVSLGLSDVACWSDCSRGIINMIRMVDTTL